MHKFAMLFFLKKRPSDRQKNLFVTAFFKNAKKCLILLEKMQFYPIPVL